MGTQNQDFCKIGGKWGYNDLRTPLGVGKKEGRGEPHEGHPSQKGVLDPPAWKVWASLLLFFLYRNPRLSRPQALWEGSRYFWSCVLWYVSSLHTLCSPMSWAGMMDRLVRVLTRNSRARPLKLSRIAICFNKHHSFRNCYTQEYIVLEYFRGLQLQLSNGLQINLYCSYSFLVLFSQNTVAGSNFPWALSDSCIRWIHRGFEAHVCRKLEIPFRHLLWAIWFGFGGSARLYLQFLACSSDFQSVTLTFGGGGSELFC